MKSIDRHTQITGEIESVSFHNAANGWSVLRLRPDDDPQLITVTGYFASVKTGEYLQISGSWTEHRSYGRQFKAEQASYIRPTSTDGILRYLASGLVKGIGEKTAKKIVSHFKEKTFIILDQSPHRLREVPSIGRKKSDAIAQVWSENKTFREIEIFLSAHELSPHLIQKIIRQYRNRTIEVLKENPYRIASEISGIGFATADRIAQKLGLPADSIQRIKSAALFLLRLAEDQGHCFLTSEQLLKKSCQTLNLTATQVTDKLALSLRDLNQSGDIVSEPYPLGSACESSAHYRFELRTDEEVLANRLKRFASNPLTVDDERIDRWLNLYSERSSAPLSKDQLEAVKKAVSNRVFILTGGPGVGKTTTANAIIRLLMAMNRSVALAAPTGRAAQRLSEVAGIPAKTVHRLLEWNPQTQGFMKDEVNTLSAQAIVIDESSMLDLRLATALFKAISDSSQVILIGDVDQLPSVGPGNILHDLIVSEQVPYVKLIEVFRQASCSQIVQIAHTINLGKIPEFQDQPHSDCRFIAIDSPVDIRRTIIDLVSRTLPQKTNHDPILDIQVLSPMNRGDLGTKILNEELQAILNPECKDYQELKQDTISFRPGDKVIQNSNNYELNVFNGDIGLVEYAGVDGGKLHVTFGDRTVVYSKEEAYDLRLAYAITIHKSQGSEFPVVIIPISMQHFVMLQRNLVYTALTRARKLAIFVGSPQALHHAIQQQKSLTRQTQLAERIKYQ